MYTPAIYTCIECYGKCIILLIHVFTNSIIGISYMLKTCLYILITYC